MKTLDKAEMLERNKVMRVLTEARVLSAADHPFVARLCATLSTPTHLHFVLEHCGGGELYALLCKQPGKRFSENAARFYGEKFFFQFTSRVLYLLRKAKTNQKLTFLFFT